MLAIVGGSGRLPDILAQAVPDAVRFAPEGVPFGREVNSAMTFRFERLGSLVEELRGGGVRDVVFAGAMRRPQLDLSSLDPFTQSALSRIGASLQQGDDSLFRGVIAVFEGAGFRVIAAHDVIPDLLPPRGVATAAAPTDEDRSDADRGFAILHALGPFDVGQGCVVGQGQVLAIETVAGTDWMLAILAGDVPGRPAGDRTGVFCKAPKSGQDRRIDMPAIGPRTVAAIAAARLRGIVVQAGAVIVLDREETVAAADAAGLFLWAREG